MSRSSHNFQGSHMRCHYLVLVLCKPVEAVVVDTVFLSTSSFIYILLFATFSVT